MADTVWRWLGLCVRPGLRENEGKGVGVRSRGAPRERWFDVCPSVPPPKSELRRISARSMGFTRENATATPQRSCCLPVIYRSYNERSVVSRPYHTAVWRQRHDGRLTWLCARCAATQAECEQRSRTCAHLRSDRARVARESCYVCVLPLRRAPRTLPRASVSRHLPCPCPVGYNARRDTMSVAYCAGWDIGCVEIAVPCGMQCCLVSGNASRHIAWRCTQRRTGQSKRDGQAGALCVRVRACVCVRGLGGRGEGADPMELQITR
jgi:hypothetical protein